MKAEAKEAKKEFKQAEQKVKKEAVKMVNKAKKHGVDIQKLVEKNNKLWQQKYEAAEHDFEKKMKDS
jgi:hypothetical protein